MSIVEPTEEEKQWIEDTLDILPSTLKSSKGKEITKYLLSPDAVQKSINLSMII